MYPQESLSVAIAKPFEVNEIEKALKAAITEDLVCIFFFFVYKKHTNPWFCIKHATAAEYEGTAGQDQRHAD